MLCCLHFTGQGPRTAVAINLNIPREARQKLAAIVQVSDDGFRELLRFLQSHIESFGAIANVREAAKSLAHSRDVAPDIVQAVMPLLVNQIAEGKKAEDVVAAVLAALHRGQTPAAPLTTPKELALLKLRLGLILTDNAIVLKAKAMTLVNERSSLFSKAKIVSDLRPVFGAGKRGSKQVEACSIIHTLVLTCGEGGQLVKRHIALDSSDLAALKAVIERAQSKEIGLSAFIEAAKVSKIVIT